MRRFSILTVFAIILFVFCSAQVLWAAKIINIEGRVQVKFFDKGVWHKAKVGMVLGPGESIKTAVRSKADILLDEENNNFIRLEERTLLVLEGDSPEDINMIDLSEGKVYANIEKLKEGLTFEVKTPTSVSGVRGTGWSVEINKQIDEIAVFISEVFAKAFDEDGNLISEITVAEGFKVLIEKFKRIGELMKLSKEEMDEWEQFYQEVTEIIKNLGQSDDPGIYGYNKKAAETAAEIDKMNKLQDKMRNRLDDLREQIEDMSDMGDRMEDFEEHFEEQEEEWEGEGEGW